MILHVLICTAYEDKIFLTILNTELKLNRKTLKFSNIPPGVRIGSIIQNVVGLGVGIGIAFYASWRLSLLTLACIPFVAAAG